MNKLSKHIAASICLGLSLLASAVPASASLVVAMTQSGLPASISAGGMTDPPVINVAGESDAKRAAESAAGGRAVSVVRSGNNFVVTVVAGGSAKRCVVDANSGQVLGCR